MECRLPLRTMETREQWNSFPGLSEHCPARILHEIQHLSKISAKTFSEQGNKEFTGNKPALQDMTTGML